MSGCESVVTPGSRGYNYVNYHLIYYGERGTFWHGECMRSTECLLVVFVSCEVLAQRLVGMHLNNGASYAKEAGHNACTCKCIIMPQN